jgi:hypothetical protein
MNGAYVLDEMITKRLNNENTLYNSFKLWRWDTNYW